MIDTMIMRGEWIDNISTLPVDIQDKVIADISDKGIVCRDEKIDLFIDDREHHCKSVSEQGIDVLLFTALYNKECNEYKRVNSWIEVKEYIDNLNK